MAYPAVYTIRLSAATADCLTRLGKYYGLAPADLMRTHLSIAIQTEADRLKLRKPKKPRATKNKEETAAEVRDDSAAS